MFEISLQGMPQTKEKKKQIVQDLKTKIQNQKLTIFFDFSGIKTKDLSELRRELKKSENELKITKKTLTQIAFKNSGFDIDFKKIKSQLALVFGFKDEILPAKILYQFSENNPNLKILGGVFEKKLVGPEKIVELAKLPTREELLARLVGRIKAPISNLINVLEGNIKGLINVLDNLKTQMLNLNT